MSKVDFGVKRNISKKVEIDGTSGTPWDQAQTPPT